MTRRLPTANVCAPRSPLYPFDRSVCRRVFVEVIDPDDPGAPTVEPWCSLVDTSGTGPIGSRDPEHRAALLRVRGRLDALAAAWRSNTCRGVP